MIENTPRFTARHVAPHIWTKAKHTHTHTHTPYVHSLGMVLLQPTSWSKWVKWRYNVPAWRCSFKSGEHRSMQHQWRGLKPSLPCETRNLHVPAYHQTHQISRPGMGSGAVFAFQTVHLIFRASTKGSNIPHCLAINLASFIQECAKTSPPVTGELFRKVPPDDGLVHPYSLLCKKV